MKYSNARMNLVLMKVINTLLMFIFLSAGCASADSFLLNKKSQDPLLESELLKNAGKYSEAEKVLSDVISEAPNCDSNQDDLVVSVGNRTIHLSYLLYSRAVCWHSMKRFDHALTDYSKSYKLRKNNALLYFIADCMYEQEMYAEAIEKFDEYLKFSNPDRKGTYLALRGRALSVFQSGEYNQAIRDLEELKAKFPELESSIQNAIDQCLSEKTRINALRK